MSCQEESHPFQILFIPGIYCHLLDRELLSFPLLSSPINQIYYFVFMFIFFLLTSYHSCPSVFISGVFWKSIHFEVASDSFSLLINSSWLLVFATILFVLIFPYIIYLVSLIFFSYHFIINSLWLRIYPVKISWQSLNPQSWGASLISGVEPGKWILNVVWFGWRH